MSDYKSIPGVENRCDNYFSCKGAQRFITSALVGSGLGLAGVMGGCILGYEMGEHPIDRFFDYVYLGIMGTAFFIGLGSAALGVLTHRERMRTAKGISSIDDVLTE